jgi:hypothetical protein
MTGIGANWPKAAGLVRTRDANRTILSGKTPAAATQDSLSDDVPSSRKRPLTTF